MGRGDGGGAPAGTIYFATSGSFGGPLNTMDGDGGWGWSQDEPDVGDRHAMAQRHAHDADRLAMSSS